LRSYGFNTPPLAALKKGFFLSDTPLLAAESFIIRNIRANFEQHFAADFLQMSAFTLPRLLMILNYEKNNHSPYAENFKS
jgi:hypothetical protein